MPTEILGGFRSDESRAAGEECGAFRALGRIARRGLRQQRREASQQYQPPYGQQPYGQQPYDQEYAEDGTPNYYV
jgi:hypothetical protein